MIRTISLLSLLLVACGGRVADGASKLTGASDAGLTDTGAAKAPPSGSGTITPATPPDDPPPSEVDAGPAPTPSTTIEESCGGTISASDPASLVAWSFVHEHTGCPGASKCAVFVRLTDKCSLWTQDGDVPATTTMNDGDCASLRVWLASKVLQDALHSTSLCSTAPELSNPDSNEFDIGGSSYGRKTPATCTEPPLDHHRACIQAVLDAYRPGAHL